MVRDLTKLFYPKSLAVVGASRDSSKVGHALLKNIIESGYKGYVFPINPKAESIAGMKCYDSIRSLPVTPDLAIITIPATAVLKTLAESAKKGVRNVVILTSGFKEADEAGKILETQITEFARINKINLLGPNSLGFVNNIHSLNASPHKIERHRGNLKIISQSGAIASTFFDWAENDGLGFAQLITLGNKAVISESDVMSYWHKKRSKDDEPTLDIKTNDTSAISVDFNIKDRRVSSLNPIVMYLETIEDGEDFMNIASQITLHDPVLLLKPGKTLEAKKVVRSHTGAITGQDDVLDAALKQAGIIRCEGLEDLFDLSKAFSWEEPPEGPNIAIISNAGAPAVLSTDMVRQEGLKLAELSEVTKNRLQRFLPDSIDIRNPIDVQGDALADRYGNAIEALLSQHDIHGLIVIMTPQMLTQIYQTAEYIAKLSQSYKKPIICSFMGGCNIVKGEKILNLHKIPSYRYPERAIKAMGAMWRWRDDSIKRSLRLKKLTTNRLGINLNLARSFRSNQVINLVKRQKRKALNSFEANEVLRSWDIKTPDAEMVTNILDSLMFTYKHGWPVALKLSSNKFLHKTDLGGVITNITNKTKLENALEQLDQRIKNLDPELQKSVSIQIQKYISGGVEVIVGIKKDIVFGNVLLFGAGGIYAELMNDRNLHLLPIENFEAQQLVTQSKIFSILNGTRTGKEYALPKLYNLMEKLSELSENYPEISEIEINPVIVTKDDIWAVDSRVILI